MIAVDCEGLACVVGEPDKALGTSHDMSFAREQATPEADAAARALFDAGAKRVIVWDNHGFGANLIFDRLDRGAKSYSAGISVGDFLRLVKISMVS